MSLGSIPADLPNRCQTGVSHPDQGNGFSLLAKHDLPIPKDSSQPLNLSGLAETATIQPQDLALALWVLSTPQPPPSIVLPDSLVVRRRLARSGLVFAADRRGIRFEIGKDSASIPDALGLPAVDQTLALEHYDFETSDRMRVVKCLESEHRRPPMPDHQGRRYYWIDGLGVATAHPERDFFDRHADQCFFELVDNVHRWARAGRAMAIVSATSGGGEDSHNRLQIVVIDDGIGILESVRSKASNLLPREQNIQCISNDNKGKAEIAVDVITDLLCSVYGGRRVIGAQGGHGLNTVSQHVSRWDGTMNVISSFASNRSMHLGRRGSEGRWTQSEFAGNEMMGTVVHLTLHAVRCEVASTSHQPRREPAAV